MRPTKKTGNNKGRINPARIKFVCPLRKENLKIEFTNFEKNTAPIWPVTSLPPTIEYCCQAWHSMLVKPGQMIIEKQIFKITTKS